MLVIRLFRVGKKNQPYFKIVVTDKRKPPRAGRSVEEVGFYNPLKKEKALKVDRVKYWLSVGAKPSDTVYNLLVSEKIIEGKKVPLHKKAKKEKKEKVVPEKPIEEKPTEEVPKEKKPKEEAPKETPSPELPKKEREDMPEKEKPSEEKPREEILAEEKKETKEKVELPKEKKIE